MAYAPRESVFFLYLLLYENWIALEAEWGGGGEGEMGTFSCTSSQPYCLLWWARGEPLRLLLKKKWQMWFNFHSRRKHTSNQASCLPAQQEALGAMSFRMRQGFDSYFLTVSNVTLGYFCSISKASFHQKSRHIEHCRVEPCKGRVKRWACVKALVSCPLTHTRLHPNPGNLT